MLLIFQSLRLTFLKSVSNKNIFIYIFLFLLFEESLVQKIFSRFVGKFMILDSLSTSIVS